MPEQSAASDHLPGAGDTPPLLEVAADDDTEGEEEAGAEDAEGSEVILYVSATVGTGHSENVQHVAFSDWNMFYCHNPGQSKVELSNLEWYYYPKVPLLLPQPIYNLELFNAMSLYHTTLYDVVQGQ